MIVEIIQILHLILVFYLFSSIFVKNVNHKCNALAFLIFLLFHYLTRYGKCGLTELEYMIKGEAYQEGFLYRLIKPVITVREDYFENSLFYIHLIWIAILIYQTGILKLICNKIK
jgi:hypothetical protein